MANSLYLIATPIGNRDDITLRALKTLFSADILLCEDTRKTRRLLNYYQEQHYLSILINRYEIPKLVSFHEYNEERQIPQVCQWLKEGLTLGVVTNAGTPTISDPGFKLVRECVNQNIPVIPIPGPSAAISALSASGLPTDKFLFLGFLPKKMGKRQQVLEEIKQANLTCTVVIYESPFRALKTLTLIKEIYGDVEVVLARELTKLHEEITSQPISVWLKTLANKKLKGELVILFNTGGA